MQVRHARARRGFTLIELLIVVVIIGILAAIAIPRFQNTKGKAYVSAMKSDLRNLAVAEEGYYFEHQTYTTDLNLLKASRTQGVTLTVISADGAGWAATTTHALASPLTCYLFVGGPPHGPNGPATVSGAVTCQ